MINGIILFAHYFCPRTIRLSANSTKEEVYTTTYHTFEEAKAALFECIESFYNRKRRHSALGYKTPQQVEDEALAA